MLKLKCGELLSKFGFTFNLRRYTAAAAAGDARGGDGAEAGAYTRPLFSST